jgi:putative ABC transport system ATP-binding protein
MREEPKMKETSGKNNQAQLDEVILECRDVHKSFFIRGKEIAVLKGIDFSVKKSEIVVITGKSGTGKSTLLGLLAGLEPPNSGSIIFEGKNLEKMNNEELAMLRRKKIGIIFQSFNLLSSWTAYENVEGALINSGLPKIERRAKIEKLLAELGLADRMDNLPAELSVGQQQRVAVARTLINEPLLILADEPTGDVDPETGKEIMERLIAPVRKRGTAMALVTHGDSFKDTADRVFRLAEGRLRIIKS